MKSKPLNNGTQEEAAHPHPAGKNRDQSDQSKIGPKDDHHPFRPEEIGVLEGALSKGGSDRLIRLLKAKAASWYTAGVCHAPLSLDRPVHSVAVPSTIMPSFDILSKVDPQTLDNAINTVKRELETRYDLRGSNSDVEFDKKALTIKLSTEDHLKLDSILSILLERSTKQKVDVKSFDLSEQPTPSGKLLYRTVKVKQGIDRETAKKIVKFIKETGIKVQAQIMDDMVRVTGKKIDDLQQVMNSVQGKEFDVPLQFDNMKS